MACLTHEPNPFIDNHLHPDLPTKPYGFVESSAGHIGADRFLNGSDGLILLNSISPELDA